MSEIAELKELELNGVTYSLKDETARAEVSTLSEKVTTLEKEGVGKAGEDGYSPTIAVSKSNKVTTLTITDKYGTKTVMIDDGVDGEPGEKGDKGDPGSDATVTADSIIGKLGYIPAKESEVETITEEVTALQDSVDTLCWTDVGADIIISDTLSVKENVKNNIMLDAYLVHRASDATPAYSDFANGVIFNYGTSDDFVTETIPSNLIFDEQGFITASLDGEFMLCVVPYDNFKHSTTTYGKKGIYVKAEKDGKRLMSVQIPGYNNLEYAEPIVIDKKYLPNGTWSEIPDKPFGETTTYIEPLSWNGVTNGLEMIEDGDDGAGNMIYMVKLSDKAVKEDAMTSQVKVDAYIAMDGYSGDRNISSNSEIEKLTDGLYGDGGNFIFCINDEVTYNGKTYTKGIYVQYSADVYVSGLSFVGMDGIPTGEVKLIDSKYLPTDAIKDIILNVLKEKGLIT